jgi:hypothetical protein
MERQPRVRWLGQGLYSPERFATSTCASCLSALPTNLAKSMSATLLANGTLRIYLPKKWKMSRTSARWLLRLLVHARFLIYLHRHVQYQVLEGGVDAQDVSDVRRPDKPIIRSSSLTGVSDPLLFSEAVIWNCTHHASYKRPFLIIISHNLN